MDNSSELYYPKCDPQLRLPSENAIGGVIIVLMSCLAMTGNALVLLSFANCYQLRQQKGGYFVANLALSDFLCSVYIMLPSAAFLFDEKTRLYGHLCSFKAAFNATIFTTSNLNLAAISLDRAIAINRPFKYPNLMTELRVKIAIACIWIYSLTLGSVPSICGWVSFENWELNCSPKWPSTKHIYLYLTMIFSHLLPASILLLCNGSIIYAIRKSKTVVFHTGDSPEKSGNHIQVKSYRRTVKSLFVLVIVYFICMPPYFLVKSSLILTGQNILPKNLCLVPIFLLFGSSTVNPQIYGLMRKDYREAVLTTLRKILKEVKKRTDFLFGHPPKQAEPSVIRNVSSNSDN